MLVLVLVVIIILFATRKPKIMVYESDKAVLEQIEHLRKRVDLLNSELSIKVKADKELQEKSNKEISDLRLQIKSIKANANAKKNIINNADLEQSYDILTDNIKKRQR